MKNGKATTEEDLKDVEWQPSDHKPSDHSCGTLEENIDENGNINP